MRAGPVRPVPPRLRGPGRCGARPVRASAAGADQHPFHRARHGPSAAVRLALGQHGLHRLHEFPAAGRGQPAQPGEVTGEPADLARVGRARRVALGAQFGADADGGAGERLVEGGGVAGRLQHHVLPLGVADARRVAGAFVQQRVRVRDQGGRPDRAALGCRRCVRAFHRGGALRPRVGRDQGGCVEGADDDGRAAAVRGGLGDAGPHPLLAAQVEYGDARALGGVPAQGPSRQEGGAAQRFGW